MGDPSSTTLIDMAVDNATGRPVVPFGYTRNSVQTVEPISSAYCLSTKRSTMEELFHCVFHLFWEARILTIEAGYCKRAPMIQMFKTGPADNSNLDLDRFKLATLKHIQTLVLRGTKNIVTSWTHFQKMATALPDLKELHFAFTTNKVGGYYTMCDVVPYIPQTVTRLNICLDGFYNQKDMETDKQQELLQKHHLCASLGYILPYLEAVTLSGRFCQSLFLNAIVTAKHTREARLKSVDLVIRNCCRASGQWADGAGINNWPFICAFEQLVLTATKALGEFPALNFLRIRFVDLDSPCPQLSPYFHFQDNECTGIWNEDILANAAAARPKASFADIASSFGISEVPKNPADYPARRPRSIKVSSYAAFCPGTLL